MNRKDKPQQTLTGLIRSRLESYEARQFEGVTQKTLAEELTNEGRTISYSNFRTLYARAKKQLSQTHNQPPKKEITPTPTPTPATKPKTTTSKDRAGGFTYNGTEKLEDLT